MDTSSIGQSLSSFIQDNMLIILTVIGIGFIIYLVIDNWDKWKQEIERVYKKWGKNGQTEKNWIHRKTKKEV